MMIASDLIDVDKIARLMELPDAVTQRSPHMMDVRSSLRLQVSESQPGR